MKQTLLVVTLFIIYSFILLSCIGVQPPANSAATPVIKTPGSTEGEVKKSFFATVDGSTPYPTKLKVNEPTVTPSPTFPLSEQDAVATALAHMGDKSRNLRVESISVHSPIFGYTIQLQQIYQGIPIPGAYTNVVVESENVETYHSTYISKKRLPNITPTITLSEAISIAVETLRIQQDYLLHPQTKLVIIRNVFATEEEKEYEYEEFELVWRVHLTVECPSGKWYVDINAHTGNAIQFRQIDKRETSTTQEGCPTPLPIIRSTKVKSNKPTATPTATTLLSEQDAVATAIAYLGDKAPHLKIQDVNQSGKQNPTYIIDFQQTYRKKPILTALTQVNVQWNSPPTSTGFYFPDVQLPNVTSTITLKEAELIAVETLGLQGNYVIAFLHDNLIVYPVPSEGKVDKFVLAWKVYINGFCPFGSWIAYINAYTGEVLYRDVDDILREEDRGECPTPPPVPLPTKIPASRP